MKKIRTRVLRFIRAIKFDYVSIKSYCLVDVMRCISKKKSNVGLLICEHQAMHIEKEIQYRTNIMIVLF